MKRTPMPPRTVGLARGPARLNRKAPLARTAMRRAPRQPAVRAQEPRTAADTGKDWPPQVREAAQARSRGRCEIGIPGKCTGQATDLHHRQPRRTRRHGAENALAACRSCHGEVHRNPAISQAAGWIVPTWQEPAEVPVRIAGRLLWLTEAGAYVGEGAR